MYVYDIVAVRIVGAGRHDDRRPGPAAQRRPQELREHL